MIELTKTLCVIAGIIGYLTKDTDLMMFCGLILIALVIEGKNDV